MDIRAIVNEIQSNIPGKEDGDYLKYSVKEGCELLFCGKCNTPKQHRIYRPANEEREEIDEMVKSMCDCERERIEKQEAQKKKNAEKELIKEAKKKCFPFERMEEFTFEHDDGENPEITRKTKNYVHYFKEFKDGGKGLILHGSVGTGKSFFAAAICNKLIEKGYPCLFTSFRNIEKRLSSLSFEQKENYLYEITCKPSLIVFDDFGSERESDYMTDLIYDVLDARYNKGLPMIITTNLPIDKILNSSKYENVSPNLRRVFDRIVEKCYPLEITGKSKRREKYVNNKTDFDRLINSDPNE